MFRQTRRRRPRFGSTRAFSAAALPPADHLKRAFPAPEDSRFQEILQVLDRAFGHAPEKAGPGDRKPGAPLRVLPLAFLAVLAVVLLARAAIDVTWELAGERYVDEIVDEKFQNARVTPALSWK